MKRKVILLAVLALMAPFANAGVGGPPGIFYEQFYDRGDELKQDYRNVPGDAQDYERYSDELKKRNENKSEKREILDDATITTDS